jgi:hypothetical protein
MIIVPDPAAADYLRAVGAAAVYVLADPWGSSRTGSSQHLQRTFRAWEQEHFEPKWVGWVGSLSLAEWLAGAAQGYKQKNGNIIAITWEQVREVIHNAAGIPDLSAEKYAPLYPVSDHETAINNATQMAQKVRISMDVLKQKGALRPFNEAYKKYNEECRAKRERAVNYSVFETELSNSVACILATGTEPLSETILADMRRKFPFLSSVKG